MLRDNRLRRRKEFEFLGKNLYTVLFNNAIGQALNKAVFVNPNVKYWMVELIFEAGQYVLASWPWEYLYIPPLIGMGGGYFLAETAKLVLTRCLPLYLPPRNLLIPESELPIDTNLRSDVQQFTYGASHKSQLKVVPRFADSYEILFIAASPGELSSVEYESVKEELEELEKQYKGKIKVYSSCVDPYRGPDEAMTEKYAPHATFSEFFDMVLNINPHVIHFVGHGRCLDNEEGQLAFMDTKVSGKAHWVTDSEFASKLAGGGKLRLVFLQACESALAPSPYEAISGLYHNPYQAISGVAMRLAQQNIPAVVAMQYRIQSQVANSFARAFYTALAESKPIDAAMQEGRLKILTQISDWAKTSSFGLPVLYLQQSGSLLAEKGSSSQQRFTPTPGGYMGNAAPVNVAVSSTSQSVEGTSQNQLRSCPWCQETCRAGSKFCGKCGGSLICLKCDTSVIEGRAFCTECGAPLKRG